MRFIGILFLSLVFVGCSRNDHFQLPNGRPVQATVILERSFARQVSDRQFEINDHLAQDPLSADAHAQNPGVYYPRTQAALIAGSDPGKSNFLRQPLSWGTTTSSFLIPADVPVYFSVELSGGRVALAHLGGATLTRQGIGTLAIRLTAENRDAVYGGDFITEAEEPMHPAKTPANDVGATAVQSELPPKAASTPASAESAATGSHQEKTPAAAPPASTSP